MAIIIDYEELIELSIQIDDLISNNEFLLGSIISLRQLINEQELYGVEKDMYDKLELYESYFSDYYESTLWQIKSNIATVGTTFDDQDVENKKGLL